MTFLGNTFFKIKNLCVNFLFKRKNVDTVCIVYFELMYFMFNIFTTIKSNIVTKKNVIFKTIGFRINDVLL